MKYIVGQSIAAGACAEECIRNLINYGTEKSALLEEYLSREPELTEKIITDINTSIDKLVSGDAWAAVFFGMGAAVFAGTTLYEMTKKKEN